MKVTFAWQVYNNYDDVLYSSEIIYNLNLRNKCFKNLAQISQGGYEEPPTKIQTKYLNKHFNISVDTNNILVKKYKKHIGILRLIKGYENAFKFAETNKSDFLIISNADSCILDIQPLYEILKSKKMSNSCLGIRKGYIGGISFNSGSYVPFFDDHFLIFNIRQCKLEKVFKYKELKFLDNTFIDFFGIHYFIKCFLDERVPSHKVFEYTNLLDAVNHYGENCGPSLLPIQFQKKLKFLHANTTHSKKINKLRAFYFKLYNLDEFEETKKYVNEFFNKNNILINKKYNYPYFYLNIKDKIKIFIFLNLYKLYNFFRLLFFYKKYQYRIKKTHNDYNPLKYYKVINHIYPISISGRGE